MSEFLKKTHESPHRQAKDWSQTGSLERPLVVCSKASVAEGMWKSIISVCLARPLWLCCWFASPSPQAASVWFAPTESRLSSECLWSKNPRSPCYPPPRPFSRCAARDTAPDPCVRSDPPGVQVGFRLGTCGSCHIPLWPKTPRLVCVRSNKPRAAARSPAPLLCRGWPSWRAGAGRPQGPLAARPSRGTCSLRPSARPRRRCGGWAPLRSRCGRSARRGRATTRPPSPASSPPLLPRSASEPDVKRQWENQSNGCHQQLFPRSRSIVASLEKLHMTEIPPNKKSADASYLATAGTISRKLRSQDMHTCTLWTKNSSRLERSYHWQVSVLTSEEERRPVGVVRHVDGGAGAQQGVHDRVRAVLGGDVQRCEAVLHRQIHVGALHDERVHDLERRNQQTCSSEKSKPCESFWCAVVQIKGKLRTWLLESHLTLNAFKWHHYWKRAQNTLQLRRFTKYGRVSITSAKHSHWTTTFP